MLDFDRAYAELTAAGLTEWPDTLDTVLRQRTRADAHGDMPEWLAAIQSLPQVTRQPAVLDASIVGVEELDWTD